MARRRGQDELLGVITTRDRYDAAPSADYDALRGGPLVRNRTGIAPLGSGADWHLRFEIQHLRLAELARDVDRNDMFVGQGVTRLVDNVLQGGPQVDPQTGNDDFNTLLKEGWQEWCEDKMACHSLQTMNWSAMRRTSLRAQIVDGDIFQVMQNDGAAALMEAHRVRKPQNTIKNVVFGILKDDQGRPQQVWFTKENLQPAMQLNNVGATRPVDIRDSEGFEQVMHIIGERRATQTRGVTKFAPVFKPVTLIDDTVYAQLVKEQVQSCLAFLRERDQGQDGAPPPLPGTVGDPSLVASDYSMKLIQQIYPGMEVVGNPGEKLTAFSPANAGADFLNFSMFTLCILAVNLELPVEVFLLDASRGNYSSMRGNMQQARLAWQRLQRNQIDQQERPTYRWRVRAMMLEQSPRGKALRALAAKDAAIRPYAHNWHLPEWEYLDPMKDVSAAALELATGQNSPRRVANRQQIDIKQLYREIVEDRGMLKEFAILEARRLNDLYPEAKIDHRELAPMGIPSGVKMIIGAKAEPDGDESKSKGKSDAAD